jgi:hypothetical protein
VGDAPLTGGGRARPSREHFARVDLTAPVSVRDTAAMLKSPRLVVLVAVTVMPLACGGGGSAGSDFCQSWAAAFCHKIYQCPTTDPNPLAGTSEANCTAGWTQVCTNKPPAGETFDINCSAGQTINQAAKTSCLNSLASATCDQFDDPGYTDVCDQVCPQSADTDGGSAGATSGTAGATGGTAGATGGTAGATGSTAGTTGGTAGAVGGTAGAGATASADVTTFCHQTDDQSCDKIFACVPAADRDADFTAAFGATPADCKSTVEAGDCVDAPAQCPNYDQSSATVCLQKTAAQTCADFLNLVQIDECASACP